VTLKEKALYHQISPWKLAADIGCEPVSLYFFWQHSLALGFVTHFLPPIVASALLLRYGNFEAYKSSAAGAYLLRHMTRTVELVRLAGDVAMMFGAWFHEPWLIAFGVAVIVVAWSSGLLRKQRSA
jgi:hypothetical protein